MKDYRAVLEERCAGPFQRILETCWTWDEQLSTRASYPAWPYVASNYGSSPRVLFVGKAHEQWPSVSVGRKGRKPGHLQGRELEGSLRELKERFDPADLDGIIGHLQDLNDEFIEEVEAGGYGSAFWRFVTRLVELVGAEPGAFAWTNMVPVCTHPRGLPGRTLQDAQRDFRPFVAETARAVGADYVVVTASEDWQRHVAVALPVEWEKLAAPIPAKGKAKTWRRASLPGGGIAVRAWHPERSSSGLADAVAAVLLSTEC